MCEYLISLRGNVETLMSGLDEALIGITRLLIVIKGSPDPDVLASSFALKMICNNRNIDSTIISLMDVSLPQNRALITRLDIPVVFVKRIYSPVDFDGYAVLDYQSAWIDDIGTKIPCVIHIDHHAPIDDKVTPKFKYCTEDVGAVSTLFSHILQENPEMLDPDILKNVTTALYFGIKIDTDDFQHANETDMKCVEWLKSSSDHSAIIEMENIPFSEETITVISKAMMNGHYYKDWLFCGVGYLPEQYRDSIAVSADYILKNEDIFGVAVFALIERNDGKGLFLDTSIRTSEESFDLNRFIKYVAPEGGARTYKGAFQINLDFFRSVPDKTALWNLVRNTTIANLSDARDHYPAISFETLFAKVKRKLGRFFDF